MARAHVETDVLPPAGSDPAPVQPAPRQKSRPASQPGARCRPRSWYARCKRGLDAAAALFLLLLAAPFLLAGAVLVKLTSRGPAFYWQVRLGRGGRLYRIYKLRSMVHQCESLTGPRWSMPGDPRITPVGRLLRKSHLDELPQLWNVVKGDMSLVGPRPERPEFAAELEQLPGYRERLLVRPGITGLAQVQLPADTDLAGVRRKLAYDLYYIDRLGAGLDLRILLATALYLAGVPAVRLRRLLSLPLFETAERCLPAPAARTSPGRRKKSPSRKPVPGANA